jgi:hypothetical protein
MGNKTVRAALLKRYTHLPALLSLLQSRQLVLLSPSSWEDKNDRVFMTEFARAQGFNTLLALCFSQAAETFHHWKIFAPGASGVCIEFHKELLLGSLPKLGFKQRRITYKKPTSLLAGYATKSQLAFIKGWAYRDEKEFRIVYSAEPEEPEPKSIPISLSTIRSIVVNPWLPAPLYEATRTAINCIQGCENIPVMQSKVIDNEHWQAYAKAS